MLEAVVVCFDGLVVGEEVAAVADYFEVQPRQVFESNSLKKNILSNFPHKKIIIVPTPKIFSCNFGWCWAD